MPRPVRVVTLIDLIGPIGGAEHLAMQLATRLDRDRFAPSVCVSRLDTGEPEPGPMADAVEEMRRDGIPVFGLGRTSSRDLRPWRRLGAHLRGGADVLHSHKFGSNLWGALVGSLAATPVVVAHEHSWSFEGEPVRKLLDRHVIGRLSDAVIAVSSEDRRRMIEIEGLAPDKVRRIPNGAPDSPAPDGPDVRAELGIPAGAPVLGSVGMLRAEKAFEVLVDAAARLRGDHPDVRVLIAGEGDQRDALERRIAEQGLQDVVLLLGHRRDVPEVLASFDVAVCCSDFEGMPMSVLEYMDARLPVVATRVGGMPDLVSEGEHGLLVAPRDPAALAAAADTLLADPDRRRAMGESARARRHEEFGIDTMARRVEDLYTELLDRAAPRGR